MLKFKEEILLLIKYNPNMIKHEKISTIKILPLIKLVNNNNK